jgi:RHS repeat-associated protein
MNASVLVGTVNQTFTYDDLYQLKTASGLYQNRRDWRWGYTYSQSYDEIGNITQKDQHSYREKLNNGRYVFDHTELLQSYHNEYQYNGGRPHAPSRVNETVPPETQPRPIDLTYDASGNQIRRLYRNAEPRTITWDADDRVKVVNLNGQDMSVMRYDGAGERAAHLHHVSGLEETAYMDQHLTIRDGRFHTKHIYAGDMRMASKMDPDWFQYPPTLYYHPDHLGSTNFVSNDDQTLTQHDEYFPSGERWWDETDSRYELYKTYIFSGKELDQAIGLYYYGARYYDARQGQWVSPDPILNRYMNGEHDGGVYAPKNLGLYTYVWNRPLSVVDPTGECPSCQFTGTDFRWQERFARDPEGAKRELQQQGRGFVGALKSIFGRVMSWRGDVTSSSEVAQAAALASGSKMSDAGDKMLASSGDQQDSPEDKLNRAYGAAAGAVVAVVAGVLSGKAQKAANGHKVGTLPKPPTGPGAVPKAERDPKRVWTPTERDAKRSAQGDKCATGCGTTIDESNSRGHHVQRHADGGKTDDANHAEVCVDCHERLHSVE